jgi:hydroxypyruvate isomerase
MELGLCIEMALSKLPFEQRLKQAAAVGFKNVEMWFVDMSYKGSPEDLKALAKKYGVKITNTVIGSPDGSIGGGLTNPKNRKQWLERARYTLDFTKRAGIGATIVCTGNEVRGMTDAAMMKSVLDGLKPTLKLAEEYGITLLLEPLNTRYDHPGYWLHSSDRGAEICRKLKSPRMKLLFDCYHMQIMEGDLLKHIERNFDVIGHFHSAGVPGRNEVFKGETDYPFVLAGIEKLGYRGVFGLEYQPTIDDVKSLKETRKYLGK